MSKKILEQMLQICTPKQLDFFNKIYPEGPKPNQIKWAIQQIVNTIRDVNIDVDKLKDIKKEFDDFKKLSADNESTHIREINSLARDLAIANSEIERLSADKVNVDNAEIIKRLDMLDALESGGVDNWDWYGECMSTMYKED
jgi:hypothetical protein